jgi:serralysin
MRSLPLTVTIALLATVPAQAATFGMSGSTLEYRAGTGEVNAPSIQSSPGEIRVTDSAGAVTAGAGCQADPNFSGGVVCPSTGISRVIVKLFDKNDRLQSSPSSGANLPAGVALTVNGGGGDDFIYGTKGNDTILGTGGNDNLYGAGGRDNIHGGPGNDRLQGQGLLYGESGNDYLNLFPGRVKSKAYGGAGNDNILGGNKVRDLADCGKGSKDQFTTTDKRGTDRFRSCETHLP